MSDSTVNKEGTSPDVPIGLGPEGVVSLYADIVNTLETMAGSYAYAVRKGVLRDAARLIMDLERRERNSASMAVTYLARAEAAERSLSEERIDAARWRKLCAVAFEPDFDAYDADGLTAEIDRRIAEEAPK